MMPICWGYANATQGQRGRQWWHKHCGILMLFSLLGTGEPLPALSFTANSHQLVAWPALPKVVSRNGKLKKPAPSSLFLGFYSGCLHSLIDLFFLFLSLIYSFSIERWGTLPKHCQSFFGFEWSPSLSDMFALCRAPGKPFVPLKQNFTWAIQAQVKHWNDSVKRRGHGNLLSCSPPHRVVVFTRALAGNRKKKNLILYFSFFLGEQWRRKKTFIQTWSPRAWMMTHFVNTGER